MEIHNISYHRKHYRNEYTILECIMTIKYKENKPFTFITGLTAIIALGFIVAIPTAIVWGTIYATTLYISSIFGG